MTVLHDGDRDVCSTWRASRRPPGPSLLLLLAPVAPLLGVAAAWARGTDPAYELVAATPRAGLYLVLRRTLAVLVVVIPALTVAGCRSARRRLAGCCRAWRSPPARWRSAALIGVPRAAAVLAAGWVAGGGRAELRRPEDAAAAPAGKPAGVARGHRRRRSHRRAAARRLHPAAQRPMTLREHTMIRALTTAETAPTTYPWVVQSTG